MVRAMSVRIRVEGRSQAARSGRRLVQRYATRMLRALELETHELSILLCDDAVMRRLNRAYRNIDKPTDVLAFAMREGPGTFVSVRADLLGDVAISWPTATRQARDHRWAPEREVCMLLAHGLLHVLGFDHATRAEDRRMRARTDLLMMAALNARASVDKPGGRSATPTVTHS
jgi:probable rRNA maturation factor